MPESTTAPVTTEGLRERMIQTVLAAGREVDVNAIRAIAADLSPALEHAASQAAEVERLRAELAEAQRRIGHYEAAREASTRELQGLADQLYASCICDPNPETTEGMLEDCPVHGADEHRPLSLRKRASEAEAERDALTAELEGLRHERPFLLQDLSETHGELEAVVAAVRTAQITHIRDTHPDRMYDPDCAGCQVLVPLSRDLPSKPDDPDELRRRLAALDAPETAQSGSTDHQTTQQIGDGWLGNLADMSLAAAREKFGPAFAPETPGDAEEATDE